MSPGSLLVEDVLGVGERNRGMGRESFFLWVLRKVSKREFWREKEAKTKSNEGGFISRHILGGKFFIVKYPLPYVFLSFAIVEAYRML